MVKKYPPTEDELKRHREFIPSSELKFYQIIDVLDDNWHVWHSVRWDKKKSITSGEADYLLFNPTLGFIVIEVKGGEISTENGTFYSRNINTYEKNALKDPFNQAEASMYHIKDFYVKKAKLEKDSHEFLKKGNQFPLSFAYGVFFPDCQFKQGSEPLQYDFPKIFDESDLTEQLEWMGNKTTEALSPLEKYLIGLLRPFKKYRVQKPNIANFFPKLIGANISRFINLKKYYEVREQELEEINHVQDFLINSLSAKKRCLFQGSAGSGKTFIAMKKALDQYRKKKSILLLCFNSELRESMRNYISSQLGKPYEKIKGKISVYSLHLFLKKLKVMFDGEGKLIIELALSNFKYKPIASVIKKNKLQIPISFLYDAVIVDEAQDIVVSLRKVLSYFLKDQKDSLFYVFYDEEQALFVEDFSIDDFGMDPNTDLIILNRNLRNTIEIANWLRKKTSFGHYEEFSGINGFKISSHRFSNPKEALITTMDIVKKEYLTQGISPEKITILSYYKLRTIISGCKSNDYCDYYELIDRKTNKKYYVVEPNSIGEMEKIKCLDEINCEWCIPFKTISSFKGLESDILFLVLPNLEEFKQKYPDRYKSFLIQIYVGASRAKFKLYFFEY